MILTPGLAFFEVILAVHIMAAVVAFGVTFAYPLMFTIAGKHDPKSLPVLHKIAYTIDRSLVNPGLLVVILAGIYLASKLHQWSAFYVQWGLGVAIVIGALVGAVMIPTGKRAETAARRDLAAMGEDEGMSEEYQGLVKRLSTVGAALSVLVLATIFFMATKTGG